MDMQNVAKLEIPEGEVRTIHDKNGDLLWGKVSYSVKYKGDTTQNGTPAPSAPVPVQTVTGENVVKISDGRNEQSYEVNLESKNLLDITTLTYGYVLGGGGFADTHAYGEMRSRYIKVDPSTTYTFSIVETSSSYESWFGIGEYSAYSSGFIIRQTQSTSGATSFTFTTSANCQYVVLSARNLEAATKVQFEKASTPTSWEAFWQIELCKIGTYQDYIYKSGGKWYVHKETGKRTYIADDITIAASDTYSNVRYAQFPKGADNKQYGNYTYGDIINFFTHGINMGSVPAGGWNSYIGDGLIYNSAMQDNYWCSFSKSTTLATMKEKLNGMVAYYVLATSTDTEITNQALAAQLEAVEQRLIRYGYNATISGNLPIIIDRTAL